MKTPTLTTLLAIAVVGSAMAQSPVPGGIRDVLGPDFQAAPHTRAPRQEKPTKPSNLDTAILRWNRIAVDASGLDHTPVEDGEERVYGEQLGPCRASRAMAIVHIAQFEAVNSIQQKYASYLGLPRARSGASPVAALAQASRDALVAMFPSQSEYFDAYLAEDLAVLPEGVGKTNGIEAGMRAAASVVSRRTDDGSNHTEPVLGVDYVTSTEVGKWRQDPVSLGKIALGAFWPDVTPFLMQSADQFRLPPPPLIDTLEYTQAYNEAKRLGGDGVNTPNERTDEESEIGIFWAYDGTPSLCAPPRLYNQVARTIAEIKDTRGIELLRLFALINVAMADTAIAAWDSKYHYEVGRPVTVIREAASDDNVDTIADAAYYPFGAPASNLNGPNFTPPFPAYPSGHAAFGGALFQTLRRFYRSDDIPFTFVSDEYNGVTTDNEGNVREFHPRTFESLSDAEAENAESRIFLGIHWNYDATGGIELGRSVGNWVFDHLYSPGRPRR